MSATLAEELRETIAAAAAVVAVGAGTHAGIGGPVVGAVEVHAPPGIVDVAPSDMTVTVRAGTTFAELDAALAAHGQECPLDPDDSAATIGGTIAAGLSGPRRLGLGPLRDYLLEVRFVTADGREIRGGGPTVKNVTGYDIPRLFVGSLGTLGVITQVILRSRPRPRASQWFRASSTASEARSTLFAPTAIVVGPADVSVLLEGDPGDLRSEAAVAGLVPSDPLPSLIGAHRGRISIDPALVDTLTLELDAIDGLHRLAEYGVGTVHVASDTPE
ncbi:MAG: FAD-binding protein, partial [Acidimicrobiia bacterium]